MTSLTANEIGEMLLSEFEDLRPKATWGETSFFINPGGKLPNGAYFATIKEKDGENDRASNLDREGTLRFNFGPGKKHYEALFGTPPSRPSKGGVIEGPWDFTEFDTLMPHPVYGWMGWLCVLNPSQATMQEIRPLLAAAYAKANASLKKRMPVS